MFWIPRPLLNGTILGAPTSFRTPSRNLRASRATDDRLGASHFVECVQIDDAQNFIAEWTDLASRALEPNVFLEPSFALLAARHLPGAQRPEFLLVWESGVIEARGRLVGLWPLLLPSTVFGSNAKAWVHEFCCSGAPLVDRVQSFLVVELMFKWFKERYPHVHALSAEQLLKIGPTCALLNEFTYNRSLSFNFLAQYERAALDATLVGVGARDFISPKKKKELQRQFRRLRELGPVAFAMTQDGPDLRDQVEAFMALEAKGWKGRRGTAFLNDPGRATFLRAMTRTMGSEGKCHLYSLTVDGRMVAANIVLLGGERVYFWKTTYDEDFAFASPGVLLTMDMTDRLLREPLILGADSCAIPNHPMIDHIWRGRLRVADVMTSVRSDRLSAFNGALQREQFRRKLRNKAKLALARFRSD
jgi:CelD/BcsL family acetyltransferase involved in cellulose biosynthesis